METNVDPIENLFSIVEILKRFDLYEKKLSDSKIELTELENEASSIIKNPESGDKLNSKLLSLDAYYRDRETPDKKTIQVSGKEITFEPLRGKGSKKTILQHAVEDFSNRDTEAKYTLEVIIKEVAEKCPALILHAEKGAAPLLSAILMKSSSLISLMLENLKKDEKADLTKVNFESVEKGRILCAGTVYQVAALTLDINIFKKFLDFSGEKSIKDISKEFGDNVLHALIRYGSRAKSKTDQIIEMLDNLQRLENHKSSVLGLWTKQNKDGLTPLQLAAEMGQHKIFDYIMGLEMLYYFKDGDEDSYDVTEIETVPNDNQIVHKPVLHLIRYIPDKYAIPIANSPAVKAVIDTKWKRYGYLFFIWFLIHWLIMAICTVYAVKRAQLANPFSQENSKDADIAFRLGICVFVYGTLCILMQIVRNINKFRRKRYQTLKRRYIFSSGFVFPWIFGLFGLLVVIDFPLAYILVSYDNFLLPYALIFGWGLLLYFLQTINFLSVFVVLIQRLGLIMIQFAIVATCFLFGFSSAVYLALRKVENEDEPSKFQHFGKTMFKMLAILVGQGDLDVVLDAEYLFMSIPIFVMFVLLCNVLLLNALIAYMTEMCILIAEYGKRGSISSKVYARLQRAVLIVQLEDFLRIRLMKSGVSSVALSSFPDRNRKYVTLRKPKEFSLEAESDEMQSEMQRPLINNKVFPDKTKTLEITEITQSLCTNHCKFCEGREFYSTRRIN